MESFKEHLSQMAEGTKVDTDVETRVDTDAQDPPPPVDNREKEPEVEEDKKKTKYESLLKRLQVRRPDIRV